MCGLFGFASANGTPPEAVVNRAEAALASLHHRGPDQQGYVLEDGVFMGHTRLSILDLSDAGRQPFVSADGLTAAAVNGEIYNFQAIRRDLGEALFASASDSEVVLHGYRELGIEGLLAAVDGMYAAAVHDRKAGVVSLFRDRVGIKPLYYGTVKCEGVELFVWASELKAIVVFADSLTIDPSAILDFAAQRFIPAPKSIYREIRKLPAAHSLTVGNGRVPQPSSYWSLPLVSSDVWNESGVCEEIRDLVDASVSEQLVADVPVSLFLSGGMDSSVLCESAARQVTKLRTYNISFRAQGRDEAHFARTMAQLCGTDHVEESFGAKDAQHVLERMDAWFDEPFGDLSTIPTARVCSLAKEGSTVALSGDGGDELFGGYNWYPRYQRLRRLTRLVPGQKCWKVPFRRPPENVFQKIVNRIALVGQLDPLHQYAAVLSNLLYCELDSFREWLEIPDDYDHMWSLRPHYKPEIGQFKSLQYLDFHTFLPDDLLVKVDRVSMAVSLEVRVPFLKKELCELAFSLPDAFHTTGGDLKAGMKRAFVDRLPPEIIARDKQGFGVPAALREDDVLAGHANVVDYRLAKVRDQGLSGAFG